MVIERPSTDTDDEVVTSARDGVGWIVLNRPRAINALTTGMIEQIDAALDRWEHDGSVRVIVLAGAGERGLCAGGDVVAVRAAGLAGDPDAGRFFETEYAVDLRLATSPVPVVAVMDGVVMGGGLGLSAFAAHRVVTERSRLAMPETIIGFFPDVGMTYLLARAPGELGTHVALTGATFGGADAIALGLADVLVDSTALDAEVGAAVDAFLAGGLPEGDRPDAPLQEERGWIDRSYAGDDVAEIVRRLEAAPEPGAAVALEAIRARSPLAVAVTLEALRQAGRAESLAEVFDRDRVVARNSIEHAEFAEGVRAQLVDKDRSPRWRHARVEDVTCAEVEAFFA